MVALVSLHKEESSKKYFESIINAKVQPGEHGNHNNTSSPALSAQRQLSPIEVLFHKVRREWGGDGTGGECHERKGGKEQ